MKVMSYNKLQRCHTVLVKPVDLPARWLELRHFIDNAGVRKSIWMLLVKV